MYFLKFYNLKHLGKLPYPVPKLLPYGATSQTLRFSTTKLMVITYKTYPIDS